MSNCPACTRFYSDFVKPVCDLTFCPLRAEGVTAEDDDDLDGEPVLFHAKRDPLICPGRDEHDFTGWREFEDGNGGEQVCKHCGIGAMEHSLALDI